MVKKNFTRKDLANKVHKRLGFSKNFSSNFIDNVFEKLTENIIKYSYIKISSFGTFKVHNKKARPGRNPKTKVEVNISARNVVKFIPSKIFKKKINSKNGL